MHTILCGELLLYPNYEQCLGYTFLELLITSLEVTKSEPKATSNSSSGSSASNADTAAAAARAAAVARAQGSLAASSSTSSSSSSGSSGNNVDSSRDLTPPELRPSDQVSQVFWSIYLHVYTCMYYCVGRVCCLLRRGSACSQHYIIAQRHHCSAVHQATGRLLRYQIHSFLNGFYSLSHCGVQLLAAMAVSVSACTISICMHKL
jgi:hypothetical protein